MDEALDRIKNHFEALYGKDVSESILPRVQQLLQRHGRRPGKLDAGLRSMSLNQRDALLITYGDQVQQTGLAPLKVLDRFMEKHLRGIVSGVHLLPFYPFSSDDGFSVLDWFAVDPALGTWEDVERLGRSFDLMFDGVLNHLSVRGPWFQKFLQDAPEYREFFITVEGEPDLRGVVRPRALPLLTEVEGKGGKRKVWTTFSADQADLNFKNPEVLLAALEALLFYVKKGARFIRLDAIAYLWKELGTACIHLAQTHRIIQLMRAVLDAVAPEVLLITETNVPHADNLSYLGDGTNEAQLVYNFALPPLVLDALATGRVGHLTPWAASLKLPSRGVTFFNFLASHDGIGLNPVRGILSRAAIDGLCRRAEAHGGFVSYKDNPDGSQSAYELNINFFDALSNPKNSMEPIKTQVDRFLVAQAIMLALAGVPGIYFHSLFGSRSDRAAADASGIPRRINRQKLSRSELEQELRDPSSLRAQVFARFKHLLQVRQGQPAFSPCADQQVLVVDDRVFALRRQTVGVNDCVLCLHNVTDQPVAIKLKLPDVGPGTSWLDLISGEQKGPETDGFLSIDLAPYQIVWARQK